jgi:hypothetical protein
VVGIHTSTRGPYGRPSSRSPQFRSRRSTFPRDYCRLRRIESKRFANTGTCVPHTGTDKPIASLQPPSFPSSPQPPAALPAAVAIRTPIAYSARQRMQTTNDYLLTVSPPKTQKCVSSRRSLNDAMKPKSIRVASFRCVFRCGNKIARHLLKMLGLSPIEVRKNSD